MLKHFFLVHSYVQAGIVSKTEETEWAKRSIDVHVKVCAKCGKAKVTALKASPWSLKPNVIEGAVNA
jgi:regulation of enolase protein 1 (concanavalin A-like superfamily)